MKRSWIKRGTSQMKRSGFKQKVSVPMKRSALKRGTSKMKTTRIRKVGISLASKLASLLWSIFSLFIKMRDGWRCFTCDVVIKGSKMHAGHFIEDAVGGVRLRYDERNVHAQCETCNITLGGNKKVYEARLIEKYGKTIIVELRALIHVTERYFNYDKKIYHYEQEVEKMKNKIDFDVENEPSFEIPQLKEGAEFGVKI